MGDSSVKVTHLLHTMAYGGIETVIINWLKAMPRSEVDVQLIVFKMPDDSERPFVVEAAKEGLRVEYIHWSRWKPVGRAAKELRELLRSHGTEVLHAHNTYAELVAWWAARGTPVKLMSTFYVWDRGFGFKRLILQKLSAALTAKYDKLSAQCKKTAEDGVEWGVPFESVEILPSGFEVPPPSLLDLDSRRRLRAERGAGDSTLVVCNIARLYPEKGHARLLEHWPDIVRKVPSAVLWIYGVGPLQKELEALHEEFGLGESVRFLGFASNLMDELSLCDVQIHPSFNEGVPLAICSGMAAGLPIVSTAVGGIPEVIENGKSGYLVDVDDMESLKDRAVSLLQDSSLRKRMGSEAKRFIAEEYSLEAAVAILAQSYRSLVGR